MFGEGNGILLLLPRSVDIGEEQRDVMAANQGHDTRVVMFLHTSLDIRPSCSFIGLLAFINSFVGHFLWSGLSWTFTDGINPCTNTINIVF